MILVILNLKIDNLLRDNSTHKKTDMDIVVQVILWRQLYCLLCELSTHKVTTTQSYFLDIRQSLRHGKSCPFSSLMIAHKQLDNTVPPIFP
jgi:hypothetical protein